MAGALGRVTRSRFHQPDRTLADVYRSAPEGSPRRRRRLYPVVERGRPDHLCGIITQFDLLAARQRSLPEERHAERVLTLRRVREGS